MNKPFSAYIAGPWSDRVAAEGIAKRFADAGIPVTHPWWHLEGEEDDHTYLRECAMNDIEGVVEADVLVVLNSAMSEGKAVETGIAIILMKPIIIIGERSNIFHHLNIPLVATPEMALELALKLREAICPSPNLLSE